MLASKYMNEPQLVRIQTKNITLDEIRQIVVETTERARFDSLCRIIDEFNPFMAIIFCRTKKRVTSLNIALQQKGYSSEEIHGDLTQGKREKVMKAFRKAELQFLVATDVAARGLDIDGVTHIFNYDVPPDAESYIHRIGRTGRAGNAGVAVTFAASLDRESIALIEEGIRSKIEKRKISKEECESNEVISSLKEQGHRGHTRFEGSRNERAGRNYGSKLKRSSNKAGRGNKSFDGNPSYGKRPKNEKRSLRRGEGGRPSKA
jgi:ATP-dependent RNA helicase DeaD